jgi:arsenate reductase
MAEGLFRHLSKSAYDAYSAGVSPSTVNPLAIRAMNEIGIDISHHTSDNADDYASQAFDLVITVCDNAKEACPIFPGAKDMQHWPFDDPADAEGTEEERMPVFRSVRDEIRDKIEDYLKQIPDV